MTANQQRIEEHIELLSQFTATPGEGVTRLTYSEEDLQARNYIKEKMVEYGLSVSRKMALAIFLANLKALYQTPLPLSSALILILFRMAERMTELQVLLSD